MAFDPKIFHDYDIRGKVPGELNEEAIKRIVRGLIGVFGPASVQLGRDMRTHSEGFQTVAINEFLESGVDVTDLGLISTDMLYFAAGKYPEDLALTISASHNPAEYNGMKMVKKGALAIGADTGIYEVRDAALAADKPLGSGRKGTFGKRNVLSSWANKVTSFIDSGALFSFKIVVDAGNGMAGYFMPEIERRIPFEATRLYYDLDGTFPNHTPNPLKKENLKDLITAVLEKKADFGLAFDGDGDRVFLVDDKGKMVSGTVMTAMIAEQVLKKNPDSLVLYNAVVGRVVPETVKKMGGRSERVRVGHTLIKDEMRKRDAIFAGEHSGHYYFRDFYYADSAAAAALIVAEFLSGEDRPLSLVSSEYDIYPASGEINFEVEDKKAILEKIKGFYKSKAQKIDELDGVSVWFPDWWVSLRSSNTENLLRLNLEADNKEVFERELDEVIGKIESLGARRVV